MIKADWILEYTDWIRIEWWSLIGYESMYDQEYTSYNTPISQYFQVQKYANRERGAYELFWHRLTTDDYLFFYAR